MSYHIFFGFSTGLTKAMKVPKGTRQSIIEHIAKVEKALHLKRERYLDNPWHWSHVPWRLIDDNVACEIVSEHNAFVRHLYDRLGEWSKTTPPAPHDRLTAKESSEFFPGLKTLEVPPEKWTKEFYREEMETLFEVMRGRPTNGISFDEKALTPRQAAQVINLFSPFLDAHDLRLDCPRDRDQLKSSYDGGYSWCDTCGKAIDEDDIAERCRNCPKKLCSIKQDYGRDE